MQRKKRLQALAGNRQISFRIGAAPNSHARVELGARTEQKVPPVESGEGRDEIGTRMRQLEPSGFRAERGQRAQPVLPEQRMAEALKQIYATAGSLAGGHGNTLAAALQTLCQVVKDTCAVDSVQLWLVEGGTEQRPSAHWLKRRACSDDCSKFDLYS